MSLMMMLMLSGKPAGSPGTPPKTTYTRTFTSNATFAVPAGVTVLDSAVGHGANGSPASSGTSYRMYKYQYRVHNYANGGTNVGSAHLLENQLSSPGATPPGGYCDPLVNGSDGTTGVTGSDGSYYPVTSYQDCYYYEYHEIPYSNPATTGASASGFGKVFPGGTGGTAPTTSFTNVAVTGGASYSISVPSGGSITITYKA